VQLVSEQTQRNFLVDPSVCGTVTVFAPTPVAPAAMYEIFLNILELNDLTIVEGEGIDRIVPLSAARQLTPGGSRGMGGAFEEMLPVLQAVANPPSGASISADSNADTIVVSGPSEFRTLMRNVVSQLNLPQQRSQSPWWPSREATPS